MIKNRFTYIALGEDGDLNKNIITYRPSSIKIIPLKENYVTGSIVRYFFKKKNESEIHETSSAEYDRISETLYSKFSCKWYISGSVNFAKKENSISASKMLDKFGTNSILNDPLEFFRS